MSWKLPIYTDYMKAQMEHEETRAYAEEIFKTVKKYKKDYGRALEIGAAWGVSALSILLAGDGYLTSVDANPKVRAHDQIAGIGFQKRWTFVHKDSHDFWPSNDYTYDVVMIDGSHKYPQCYEDLIEGWEVLNPGGVLIADDYTHPKNQEVEEDGTIEYGVSYGICKLIQEKQIKRIDSTPHLFIAFK